MNVKTTLLLGGALAIALVAAAYWLGMHEGTTRKAASAPSTVPSSGRSVEFWYDPMHPETHFDAPGKSPFMEMALVPKYADAAVDVGVRIDPRMTQNLGIRTATPTMGTLERSVHAVGHVEADERSIRRVTVRADAWVEALAVRAEGEHVTQRQL